jgi:hypothetical protein
MRFKAHPRHHPIGCTRQGKVASDWRGTAITMTPVNRDQTPDSLADAKNDIPRGLAAWPGLGSHPHSTVQKTGCTLLKDRFI